MRFVATSPQLGTESGNTRTGNLGQPLIICIGSNPEQLLDTLASDRRDDPKLCKMSADGIDHRGLRRMNKCAEGTDPAVRSYDQGLAPIQ